MSDEHDDERIEVPARGLPMVATWPRWLGFTLGGAGLFTLLAWAYVAISHSPRPLSGFAVPIAIASALVAVLVVVLLRSEEARLQRELRTARTGTAVIRDMVLSRRQKSPLVLRLLSTTLGHAAVLLADGERQAAIVALGQNSPFMQHGRLRQLRDLIECDVDRASGNSVTLERCVQTLRALPPIGNREADRYRIHVLTKAILEQANNDAAEDVLPEIESSTDEESRLYAVWLRAWFEIEPPSPLPEGELRLAALLARSHGADDLVKKLDDRIAAASAPSPLLPPGEGAGG